MSKTEDESLYKTSHLYIQICPQEFRHEEVIISFVNNSNDHCYSKPVLIL